MAGLKIDKFPGHYVLYADDLALALSWMGTGKLPVYVPICPNCGVPSPSGLSPIVKGCDHDVQLPSPRPGPDLWQLLPGNVVTARLNATEVNIWVEEVFKWTFSKAPGDQVAQGAVGTKFNLEELQRQLALLPLL